MDGCTDETYKSRHSEKRRKYQTDQLQGDYSKIDFEESLAGYSEVPQLNIGIEADNPIYSDLINRHSYLLLVSPSSLKSLKRYKIQNNYAVIGTTGAPEIPKKSNILVDYLETKSFNVADKKPEASDDGSCDGGGDGGGVGSSNMDDVYVQRPQPTVLPISLL